MVIYNDSSDFSEKLQHYQEYLGALEEERRKIQVFERELPLCLDLVSQTIERWRRQTSSTEGPVLEEFLPIKPVSSSTNEDDIDDDQKQDLRRKSKIICGKHKSSPCSLKSDWLASAKLSIQVRDSPMEEDFLSKNLVDMEGNKISSGGFLPYQKKTSVSSSADTDGGGGRSQGEDKGQSNKKERRCWSSDLHRLFLHVLQQLGGAHVATPKQIRELMKVDGLTNDEIKSHLQKYRLHTRRINPTIHDTQTPQLVVVGRLWMPPLEYSSQITENNNDTQSV